MNVEFHDREDQDNPRNGESFSSVEELLAFMDELRSKPPFFCELIGSDAHNLMVGISSDVGCVQYSASDGTLPYLMAVNPTPEASNGDYVEFLTGGTFTPVERRYCVPFDTVREIVAEFVRNGRCNTSVQWEEI